ncbi:MAG TPA: DNA-3-methyladenine glycosylase [Candidatus Angelobacter sp.]|nr:DNA-3-methyladenine glycosylase [Candidatus Angelobacter sp.]
MPASPASRAFFRRPSPVVARDLLGRVVVSRTPEGVVGVRLVEVEAYAGEDDPASHAWRGPTPRTRIMYGRPGHAYVYFSYGVHWCVNLVCEQEGRAAAVLLRAGQVVLGEDLARRRRRPGTLAARLASGPGNLAAALGLDGTWAGIDVVAPGSALRLRAGTPVAEEEVAVGPRIGVSRGVETPWRFLVDGNPCVSGPRRTRG